MWLPKFIITTAALDNNCWHFQTLYANINTPLYTVTQLWQKCTKFKNVTTFLTHRDNKQRTGQCHHLRSLTLFANEFVLRARTGCFGDFLSSTHTHMHAQFWVFAQLISLSKIPSYFSLVWVHRKVQMQLVCLYADFMPVIQPTFSKHLTLAERYKTKYIQVVAVFWRKTALHVMLLLRTEWSLLHYSRLPMLFSGPDNYPKLPHPHPVGDLDPQTWFLGPTWVSIPYRQTKLYATSVAT